MDYKPEKFNFNPEILVKFVQSNILLYCVVLVLVLKIAMVFVAFNLPYNIFFADITSISLENFANQARIQAGLPVLAENSELDRAAQLKANDMVNRQYFNHTSPTGVSPWFWFSKAGYDYKYAGENLAIGFYESEEVFNAWLNSPEHRANILNSNYKEIGTAVLGGFGENNAVVVVQEFGTRMPAKTVPVISNTKPAEKATPTPTVQNTGIKTPEITSKVLSQTIEPKFNYDSIISDIIYALSLIFSGSLLLISFLGFDFKLKRQFILRSILIAVLLLSAMLINKEIIISIIPHRMLIL